MFPYSKILILILIFIIQILNVQVFAQNNKSDTIKKYDNRNEAFEEYNRLKIVEKEYLNKILSNESEEFTPIKKDQNRINAIPQIELTKNAQLQYINKLFKALQTTIPSETQQSLNELIRDKNGLVINQNAILAWYQNGEQESLYLAIKAVQAMPDSTMTWNNLAAIMNMSNLQELAIPVLKYSKKKEENNVPVLNNLGQAYLALGDIPSAEQYLKDCLSKDAKHPEATRSMGVVEMNKGNKEEAAKYFERDVKENLRESSYDYLKKLQKFHKDRLATIRKYYLAQKNYKTKNFFDDLGLINLTLPNLPLSVNDTEKWLQDLDLYIQSLTEEMSYWQQQIDNITEEEENFYIHKTEPYISWLVSASVSELNDLYENDLIFITNDIIDLMAQFGMDYFNKMNEAEYPETPDLHDLNAVKAYNSIVCGIESGIMNTNMTLHNGMLKQRFDFVDGQWKSFLNELLNILELSPTPGNKKIAYRYLYMYTAFLSGVAGNVIAYQKPNGCDEMTLEEALAILKRSKRNFKMVCPAFLQYELPIPTVGSIKMSCSEFQIEGGPGSIVKAGYRKKFSDQTSTLYVKVGNSIGTKDMKLSAEVQGYLTFDKNDQLTNTGISTEAKFALPQGLVELSASAKVEMNSGYSHEVKQDSRWIQSIKKTYSKY